MLLKRFLALVLGVLENLGENATIVTELVELCTSE